MKKLLLITVLLVVGTAKLTAQKHNEIEIKKNETLISKNDENQFKILANEDVDINLKFNLQKEDAFNVLILDRKENIVISKKYHREGVNKISFVMEGKELYTIKFINTKRQNIVLTAFAKN